MPDSLSHSATPKSKWRIYHVWVTMIQRCNNQNCDAFRYYGGRGIRICERWFSFLNFIEDMGIGKVGWTIERVYNDGDYCPDNCVWALHAHQNRNRRNTLKVDLKEFRGCLVDACVHFGIPYKTVYERLRRGWKMNEEIFRIGRRKQYVIKPLKPKPLTVNELKILAFHNDRNNFSYPHHRRLA